MNDLDHEAAMATHQLMGAALAVEECARIPAMRRRLNAQDIQDTIDNLQITLALITREKLSAEIRGVV